MNSSIYITSERIEVIGYSKSGKSVRIIDYISAPLPERTMIGGNITGSQEIAEQLSMLKMKKPPLFKNVSLVIDAAAIAVKDIPVPKLNKKQYYQIVKDELAGNLISAEEAVIDYTLTQKPDKKLALLALCAPKPLIASYLEVFREAGIKLTTVRVGIETINAYIKTMPQLNDKTFVLNIVDGFSMLSVVYSMGKNVFSTRARLVGEQDDDRLLSIVNNLSPLTQFMKSEKLPDIETSYYLGLTDTQAEMLGSYGETLEVFDLLGKTKNADRITDPCHFSFMSLYNDGINLLESYKNSEKNLKEYKPVSKVWLLPVIGVLVLSAAYAAPMMLTKPIKDEIAAISEYLYSGSTLSTINEIDTVTEEMNRLQGVIAEINNVETANAELPPITEGLLDLLTRTSSDRVIIDSFQIDSEGIVNIAGSSNTQNDSASYAQALTSSSLVANVRYTGYRFDSDGRYRFSLQVILS